ncbi:MAG TPA: protein-L-isoaspartate(D-aspartate) O-methyltransferase [Solirubrobacteraceae bacterium]|nr:protein-L-isoaspartate(D-aspartate) O-methyltransferase [Solirubrobacteraceae bacterium]
MAPTREGLIAELRRNVADERVLAAIAAVPRDVFVPRERRRSAWANEALPIGGGQTISQPLVVAHMAELLDVREGDRVLDVGTGSGYHAAILAHLGGRVWSIERDPELSERAAAALTEAGVEGVELVVGDGTRGYEPAAPYDAINVGASARGEIPAALVDQLAPGGRLAIPVGERLVAVHRDPDGKLHRHDAGGVRFVPLVPDE